jgi:uncharacterized membrane protein YczE
MGKFADFLRPHRTVPLTPWSAGDSNWKAKPSTVAMLVLGLWLFGTGEAALVAAGVGVSPWVVLQQGISLKTGLTIGWATFWVSVCVLLLWIPLRRRPGLGTVLNIVVIAVSLEVMIPLLPKPSDTLSQVVEVLLGIGTVGAASAIYITCNLGAGPRDGLMTGLHDLTGVRVGRVRTSIEVVVLTIGWLLGGNVGIGTVLFGLLIGQSVAVGFGIVSRIAR